MNEKNLNLIRRIYGIILSVSVIVAGACLIAGCLYIYYSGDGYSRELVTQTFEKICIPVYICLALVIGSFVINAIIPSHPKIKPTKRYNDMYSALLKRRDTTTCDESLKKFEKSKKVLKLVNIVIIIVSAVIFLIYALNSSNFHTSEINASMISAMWVLLPCLAVPFAFSVITYYLNISNTKKQIEILKAMPAKSEQNDTAATAKNTNQKKLLTIKITILVVGVGILIFGAVTGGFADVLTKAVNICTECIGLG